MKTYDLQPTNENLIKTFLNDAIDRNSDIQAFINIIKHMESFFSVAVDSDWGDGKTFFVKQVKMILDVDNTNALSDLPENDKQRLYEYINSCNFIQASDNPIISVYYDAWAHDHDCDPILSIIYRIMQSVNMSDEIEKKRDIGNIILSIAKSVRGIDIKDCIDQLKGEDYCAQIKAADDINNLMKDLFDKLIVEHGNRLVIFIDELDRCRPNYAVELLERVKHYFNDERVTFVFSINSVQLGYSIKKYYGENFDASRYLDKFFDINIRLPR